MIPSQPASQEHARHDLELVAAAVEGDALSIGERERLATQLACPDCRALQADLLRLATSLRSDLPLPPRPRDFRLSPSTAGPARRLHLPAWLAGAPLQPFAAAVCSVGLLLVLVGVAVPGTDRPSVLQTVGNAISGPAERESSGGTGYDQAAGAPQPSAAPSAASLPGAMGSPAASAGPTAALPAVSSEEPKSPQEGPRDAGGSLPPGAEGMVGASASPGSTPPQAAPSPVSVDPAALLLAGGILLTIAGLGGLIVARRQGR